MVELNFTPREEGAKESFFCNTTMKVILLQDVKGLGKADELIEVKPGYARNYLFRKDLAVEATPENMNTIKTRQKAIRAREAQVLAEAQAIGEEIADKTFVLKIKCGSQGKLYGAITSMDVASALAEAGHNVDRRGIHLKDTIRTTVYDADVRLHSEVTVSIKVDVQAL